MSTQYKVNFLQFNFYIFRTFTTLREYIGVRNSTVGYRMVNNNIVNISFVDLDKSIIGLNIQVAIVVLSKSY